MTPDLFTNAPVTWSAVRRLYGEAAQIGGVKEWYLPGKGWQEFPATSAMALTPEKQIQAIADQGATHVQLYIDLPKPGRQGHYDTRTPDFRIDELLNIPATTPEAAEPPAIIL